MQQTIVFPNLKKLQLKKETHKRINTSDGNESLQVYSRKGMKGKKKLKYYNFRSFKILLKRSFKPSIF